MTGDLKQLDGLHRSVARLRRIVESLDDTTLVSSAYPSEWSIAQVLSHLGSGAVIQQRRLEDRLAGRDVPDDFAPSVWATWNAKEPRAQADDAIAADAALMARLDEFTASERDAFQLAMGPINLDFAAFLSLRLNEHAFHTWDVEVALDPGATIPPEIAALVVDTLEIVVMFTARPTSDLTVTIRTVEPERVFELALSPSASTLHAGSGEGVADLELPAEALARLVYGRLDAEHTPPIIGDESVLPTLRSSFPGL